jgi:pseudouridine-5'-phosphate glycosidase
MRLDCSDEVVAALGAGRAVVALESSIVAQGFPRPANRTLAAELHDAVRTAGAVPAMVAVLDGRIRVGLDAAALDRLAADPAVGKCSTRDLAFLVAGEASGATTVAATARIAAAAGIAVFATGGIGGVHRRLAGERGPLDVSADLVELSRTAIAVVASGAKSILDLAATLEALEALGVPVVGFRTGEFPAFHTARSGLKLAHRVDDVAALADLVRAQRGLGLPAALLVCNPPPAAAALAPAELEEMLRRALVEAASAGVSGGAVTPFLLAALNRLSGGRTQTVNRALALANATLAAELAMALAGWP